MEHAGIFAARSAAAYADACSCGRKPQQGTPAAHILPWWCLLSLLRDAQYCGTAGHLDHLPLSHICDCSLPRACRWCSCNAKWRSCPVRSRCGPLAQSSTADLQPLPCYTLHFSSLRASASAESLPVQAKGAGYRALHEAGQAMRDPRAHAASWAGHASSPRVPLPGVLSSVLLMSYDNPPGQVAHCDGG